jgi:site-specific DNA recombinase
VRDEREQIPIPGLVSEPAVSPEDFERVQRRLARNKASGGQVRQYYLLRGLVNCGSCGRNWRGKRRKGGRKVYYRYLCRGKESQNGKRCDHPSIDGPRLEDRVWKRVVAFLTQPELFFTAIEGQEGHSAKIADQLSTSIKRLERRLETVGDALARAYRGYAKGVVSEETYRRVDSEFQAERTWIEQELARQREELRGAERQVIDADAVRMLYPRVVEHIESASPQDKRFVLECLDAVIRIEPEMVSLSVAVPDGDVSSVSSPPGSGEGSPPIRR